MADTRTTKQPDAESAQRAVLRPGRAADPVPAGAEVATSDIDSPAINPAATPDPDESQISTDENQPTGDVEKTLAESRQRKLRLMLRQCDRVLLMDFDLLAMNNWPSNYSLAAARRSRDFWLFGAVVAATIFLSGLSGFVPAWIAGTGFGTFIIILLLGVPSVRQIYTSKPSYLDLIMRRQRMLKDARKHVAHLEGKEGLIWQCARMEEFNASLRNIRFSHLLKLSESKALPRYLVRREHVRLYLIYLLEAERAYSRVQQAFFDGNQNAIDHGWRDAVAEPELRA
jgi:hypothetical protein